MDARRTVAASARRGFRWFLFEGADAFVGDA